jgi:hypothetical protein
LIAIEAATGGLRSNGAKHMAKFISTTDQEMTLLSACMAAMLDGIAALELQGVLGDGFAATARAVETACGGYSVVLSVTGAAPS